MRLLITVRRSPALVLTEPARSESMDTSTQLPLNAPSSSTV
jgi:hypothetical protein